MKRGLVIPAIACAVLLALVAGGCGRDVVALDHIAGARVGAMAERELEAENPRLAPGTLSCPDLDFQVGATVRCLRTTELGDGRVVKVRGTVKVTSRASGGRLHVTMDDQAEEFGVAGEHVAAELRAQYLRRFHSRPGVARCPYLQGRVGAKVTCRLKLGSSSRKVDAVVTGVDPTSFRTTYVFRPHVPAS